MLWLWLTPLLVISVIALGLYLLHRDIIQRYLPFLVRIFQEKPLFIIPFGQPTPDAEELAIPSTEGVTLHGCYLGATSPRKGVVLFGLEFGSSRWSCIPYTKFLRESGYDVCAFEMRGQGNSTAQVGYDPLQWVTEFEVNDFRAALTYLKNRGDADPGGIGFFGLSKGGSAGLVVAAQDPYIRCCVTDGAFGCMTTMVPYMRKWITIYSQRPWLARIIPTWYYRHAARLGLEIIRRERQCEFVHLEPFLSQLAPRPWLMIHGSADNYIKPEMAQELFDRAGQPKQFWLVEGAKHNQSFTQANGDYQRRVLDFFQEHLTTQSAPAPRPAPSLDNGFVAKEPRFVPSPLPNP